MEWLRKVHKLLHHERLIWTMTPKANAVIAFFALLFFLKSASSYPMLGSKVYAGFLLGVSVGLFFGAYWHHAFSTNWRFYIKFYSVKTKTSQRLKMLSKKIDHELPSYIPAVVLGFVLVYLAVNNFIWLSSGLFFGFIFGGSVALAIVLKDLI
ncbi:MAG: hypothetical protein HY051_01095 [Candidatus Aenigmarchaeota archaeon]|nr:hypothetical protein [Candidatus Aenigmarchaeota archaeon]